MTTKKSTAKKATTKKHVVQYTTLTGVNLDDVFALLDEKLPDKAYKPISGGKGGTMGLTDIDPAYLPEVLTSVFGLAGVGWGYEHYEAEVSPFKNRKGGTDYSATCRIGLWFRFVSDGVVKRSDPLSVTGGSSNSQIEWAMKGALTNALGSGFMMLGYQLSVYKGERSHKDMGKNKTSPAPQQKAPAKTTGKPHPNNVNNLPKAGEVIEKLKAAKSLLDLKKIWFEYHGEGENITTFWQRLSAADREELGNVKDMVKNSFSE